MGFPMPPEPKKVYFIQVGPFDDNELCQKCVRKINEVMVADASVIVSRVVVGEVFKGVPVQLRDDRMRIYPEMSKFLLINEMKRLSEYVEKMSFGCDNRLKISEQICKIGEIVNDKNR